MYTLDNRKTFSFSAENPTGTRNGGTGVGIAKNLILQL